MAIGVDTTGANSAAGATVTITPAATVADGSMIYVVINAIHSSNDPPTGYTVPSGFTQIGSDVETEYGNTSVWRRTAGASEASSYTFTQTGGGDYSTSGALVALTGVDTSTPNGTIVSLSDTTSNTTFEIPALTTDTDNSWDVAFVGGGGALGETKTLSTWGDSLVEQADGGGDYGVAGIGAVLRATAGAQAATECVSSSADFSHAFRLEVYAAAAGRIMGSLAGPGGLAGIGGIAGQGGGLAG